MSWRRVGFIAALVAAFATGTKTGMEYAKGRYVSKDRKFIEGEAVNGEKRTKR